jgi:hypothetical protein
LVRKTIEDITSTGRKGQRRRRRMRGMATRRGEWEEAGWESGEGEEGVDI